MRWSPARVATGVALATWAAVFWFLLATGRTAYYLSSRTAWVVPLGAATLTLAALGRLVTARTPAPEVLRPRQAWGMALIVLPALMVMALPPASLGSFAASRRSAAGAGFAAPSDGVSDGRVTLTDVAWAQWSPEGSRELVRWAGSRVTFEGFVSVDQGMPADEFVLTRFIISCCVADALSVQVRVVNAPPGGFQADQWVRATGAIYPLGHEVLLDAERIEAIPEPAEPYLNP
jgi:uncharacterized repeat protein (TIGR03943 family)